MTIEPGEKRCAVDIDICGPVKCLVQPVQLRRGFDPEVYWQPKREAVTVPYNVETLRRGEFRLNGRVAVQRDDPARGPKRSVDGCTSIDHHGYNPRVFRVSECIGAHGQHSDPWHCPGRYPPRSILAFGRLLEVPVLCKVQGLRFHERILVAEFAVGLIFRAIVETIGWPHRRIHHTLYTCTVSRGEIDFHDKDVDLLDSQRFVQLGIVDGSDGDVVVGDRDQKCPIPGTLNGVRHHVDILDARSRRDRDVCE